MSAEDAARAFDQTLDASTPRVVVTYAIIAANVLVYLLMCLSGADPFKPSAADLLAWGADYGPRTASGQWWRLASAMFVHIGFRHLMYNLIAVAYVGPLVERMLGNVGFALLYLAAGVAGSLFALYVNPVQIHAGASGAVFGAYGALFVLLLRRHQGIPEQVASNLKRFVLIFIAFNLVYSLLPGISFGAHLGGVVTGFVAGWLLAESRAARVGAGRPARNATLAACALVLGGPAFIALGVHYRNLDELVAALDRAQATMQAFKQAVREVDRNQRTEAELAEAIERKFLPEWISTRASLATMRGLPTTLAVEVAPIVDGMRLREAAWQARLEYTREQRAQQQRKRPSTGGSGGSWSIHYLREQLPITAPDKNATQADIDRLRAVFARFDALYERTNALDRELSHDDFDRKLEEDLLVRWRTTRQELDALMRLPLDLGHHVANVLSFIEYRTADWTTRLDERRAQRLRETARAKERSADDAARAIARASDARLRLAY
jgi:membrane associated rhomboid family serine protease